VYKTKTNPKQHPDGKRAPAMHRRRRGMGALRRRILMAGGYKGEDLI
jgi:hypothetical protein